MKLPTAEPAHIGMPVWSMGQVWEIVGINYLGDYTIERTETLPMQYPRFDDRGRQYHTVRWRSSCRFGLPNDHGHHARLLFQEDEVQP